METKNRNDWTCDRGMRCTVFSPLPLLPGPLCWLVRFVFRLGDFVGLLFPVCLGLVLRLGYSYHFDRPLTRITEAQGAKQPSVVSVMVVSWGFRGPDSHPGAAY